MLVRVSALGVYMISGRGDAWPPLFLVVRALSSDLGHPGN